MPDDTTTVPPVGEEPKEKPFDPNEHLMDIKGKPYLEVKWRLVWANETCVNLKVTIIDKLIDPDQEVEKEVEGEWNNETRRKEKVTKRGKGYAWFHVRVEDGKGKVGEAVKTETILDFPDYAEKANTGATGRALALIGYGTQFALELEEGEDRPVDSPVDRKQKSPLPFVPPPAAVKAPTPAPAPKPASTPVPATILAPSTPTLTPKPVAPFVPNEEQQANLAILDGAFGPYEYQAFLQQYGVDPTLPRSEWTLAIYEMLMSKLEAISEGNATWKDQPITKEQYAEIKDHWGTSFGRDVVSAFKDGQFPELTKKIFKEFTRGEADEMIVKLRQAQKGKDGKLFIPETSQEQQAA